MKTARATLLFISLLLISVGCGPGKTLFKNKSLPPSRSAQELLEALPAQNFERLRYNGIGTWEQGGDRQRFRFDLRMIRDSVIWIDLADPVLGIKAARALLRPDTALFYNRLQKQYLTGQPQTLARKVALSFQFDWLWPLLTAQALPLAGDRYVKRDSGRYFLSDSPLNEGPPEGPTTTLLEYRTAPSLRLSEQTLHQVPQQRSLAVRYQQYHAQHPLPSQLTLSYKGPKPGRLTLDIRRVQPGEAFNLPFRIPDGYAPIE